MVYGIAYCPVDRNADLKDLGVDDSKQLTEAQRDALMQKIDDNNDYIGTGQRRIMRKQLTEEQSYVLLQKIDDNNFPRRTSRRRCTVAASTT